MYFWGSAEELLSRGNEEDGKNNTFVNNGAKDVNMNKWIFPSFIITKIGFLSWSLIFWSFLILHPQSRSIIMLNLHTPAEYSLWVRCTHVNESHLHILMF